MTVCVITHPRLQQRRGKLKSQGNQTDLREGQIVFVLEQRIDRRQHRLDQVIDQMRQRHGPDNAQD